MLPHEKARANASLASTEISDPVKVQVAGANVALGRIDFDYMPL